MNWSELVAPWPLHARVRSLTDDGVFVSAGLTGRVISREQRDNDLLVGVEWANDCRTRVSARDLERIGYEEGAAS